MFSPQCHVLRYIFKKQDVVRAAVYIKEKKKADFILSA